MKQGGLCEGSHDCISHFAGNRTNRCQGFFGHHMVSVLPITLFMYHE